MAAGFVIDHTTAEPDHLLDPEIALEQPLDVRARELRIAIRVEQALFSRDERALPVDVDRAALEHERRKVPVAAFDLEHLFRHDVVEIPCPVQTAFKATPGVEHPVDAAHAPATVDHEGRPDVAHPGIVARELDDTHLRRQHAAGVMELAR